MIPFILHQTWKTPDLAPRDAEWFRSWKRWNPDLDHRFYDDRQAREFVADRFPEHLAAYERLPLPVQKADFFRYLVVYAIGGLYADIDMECCRPLRHLFSGAEAVFSVEAHLTRRRQLELCYKRPYQIANCIFAAQPGHPFLKILIERTAQNALTADAKRERVEDLTGPRMLTRAFYEQTPSDVAVLHQTVLMPSRLYPDVFPFNVAVHTRHHFHGSWKGAGRRSSLMRRWIERDRLPSPFPLDRARPI